MAEDDRIRSYLNRIGQGGALEGTESDLSALIPANVGAEPQREALRNGLAKLARRGPLTPSERFGLEAIILPDKRPAILIQKGSYEVKHDLWLHLNEPETKGRLCRTFASVGRIELPGHPSLPYGGTGFVVGPDLLMTNRHVAEIFAAGLGTRATFRTGLRAGVDFLQEFGGSPSDAKRIDVRRIRMIHPYWDMALLEVEGLGGEHRALELSIRSPEDILSAGLKAAEIAVIGYPAFDPRNDVEVQNAVFGGAFNVKRLQPGWLKPRTRIESFGNDVDAVTHDASTLGGCSGAAVIDPANGQVVALHFAGRYLEANFAVPTSELARDPRVVDAGLNFRPAPAKEGDVYRRWWDVADGRESERSGVADISTAGPPRPTGDAGAASITIPLRITVELGDAQPDVARSHRVEKEEPSRGAPQAGPAVKTSAGRSAEQLAEGPQTFRDPLLSLYQSVAEQVARKASKAEGPGAPFDASVVLAAEAVAATRHAQLTEVPADRGAFETLTPLEYGKRCASLGMQLLQASVFGDTVTADRLRGELVAGECDPGWAETIDEYRKYFGLLGQGPKPLYTRPEQVGEGVLPLKSGCRVALIGDWGTGAGPARRLLGLVAEQKPDLLIHLGDIYYSGTPEECALKFEAEMVRAFGPKDSRIPIFTLAGNHDMYCGGTGYYALISELNRAPHVQAASFFCLRDDAGAWQILGMDTGQHDYSPFGVADVVTFVEADEQAWLRRRIAEFNGRTILMSHHQLFSAFSGIGPKDEKGRCNPVNPALQAMFDSFGVHRDRVAAWYWGHEHNLCIYERYVGLERGRCLGHSAVPVFVEDDPYEPLAGVRFPPKIRPGTEVTHDGRYYRHGFAMLTLAADGTGGAEYFEDQDGRAVQTFAEKL